ncbi:Methylase involved in ubiquinone/menaquinone biosynthesis [Planctomycetales bacterium 10988]|nr:Methylase involved in ubiquinone/menaquinone biosynthesis [Planctomycetales bacterium 10988]
MKRSHLEHFRPICPWCRSQRDEAYLLVLAQQIVANEEEVWEGTLHCSNPACQKEYPILDGIPILIESTRAFVSENLHFFTMRDDLSETMESILGDCCGPGSSYDSRRNYVGNYAWDHWGEFDPVERLPKTQPGSIVRLFEELWHRGQPLLRETPIHALEIGCSVGRGTWELAKKTKQPVLGIDLHFGMLQLAQRLLKTGKVRYSLRKTGVVYERCEYEVPIQAEAPLLDFWLADALSLPFLDLSLDWITSINVLDCVQQPYLKLQQMAQRLRPGGLAAFCTPFDWSPNATPMEGWIGGHSQRSPSGGRSEAKLREVLSPGQSGNSLGNLQLVDEEQSFPWKVRVNDRSAVEYSAYIAWAKRLADPRPS